MTINYARESVIDFTKPFMNLGIGILFKVYWNLSSSILILEFRPQTNFLPPIPTNLPVIQLVFFYIVVIDGFDVNVVFKYVNTKRISIKLV